MIGYAEDALKWAHKTRGWDDRAEESLVLTTTQSGVGKFGTNDSFARSVSLPSGFVCPFECVFGMCVPNLRSKDPLAVCWFCVSLPNQESAN